MSQTLTAMFASLAEAKRARGLLVEQLHLGASAVRISPDAEMSDAGYDASRPYEEKGFFGGLKDLMVPDEDRYTYAEGLRRGSALLTVEVGEAHMTRASAILEEAGAVDLDAQEATWRKEGWAGYNTTDHNVGGPMDETIKVAEERLVVGKRSVQGGSVRVRAYVIEQPVEEQVTLREETIHIERHPVDRAATATDLDGFQERTITVTETDEVAVVAKDIRVVEEIAIRKDAADRVETIRDTVRRTEVEVDDTTHAIRAAALDTANLGAMGHVADAPDGTPGNPPGTAASRALDSALGTNISGANTGSKPSAP